MCCTAPHLQGHDARQPPWTSRLHRVARGQLSRSCNRHRRWPQPLAHRTAVETNLVWALRPARRPACRGRLHTARSSTTGRQEGLGVPQTLRFVLGSMFREEELPWLAELLAQMFKCFPAPVRNGPARSGGSGRPYVMSRSSPAGEIMTLNGASALFVITNDSWSSRPKAARHSPGAVAAASHPRPRLRRSRGRDGISANRSLRTASQPNEAITSRRSDGKIAPLHALTPYVRAGDRLAYVSAAATLVSLMVSRRDKAR